MSEIAYWQRTLSVVVVTCHPPRTGGTYAAAVAPQLVRLVVPSPDRSRVLARPNGLAGWSLPVVDLAEGGWDDAALAAAARTVGSPVRPVREVVDGAWEVEALERVPRAGTAWIAPVEAARLGADREVVTRWSEPDDGGEVRG